MTRLNGPALRNRRNFQNGPAYVGGVVRALWATEDPVKLPRRTLRPPLHVEDLQQRPPVWHTIVADLHQFAAPCHANIKFSDLFPQRIAVDAQQFGAFGLVTARGIKCRLDQWQFDFAQDPVVKPGWRKMPSMQVKVSPEMLGNRSGHAVVGTKRGNDLRLVIKNRLHVRSQNPHFSTHEHQTPHGVFKLTYVAGPGICAKKFDGMAVELTYRQSILLGPLREVPGK